VSEVELPVNSNADYNLLFAEKVGTQSRRAGKIKTLEDMWTWDLEAAQENADGDAPTERPSSWRFNM
jgi:hypothetical protein